MQLVPFQPPTNFDVLINRRIIDIFIGNTRFANDTIYMPYLKGWEIAEIGKRFGFMVADGMGSGAPSRWCIMQSLMEQMNKRYRMPDLLAYLFDKTRFEHLLQQAQTPTEIEQRYQDTVRVILEVINAQLTLANKVLVLANKQFLLQDHSEHTKIEAPAIAKVIDTQYVQGLSNRISVDLEGGAFDSVISKCRTLIEEVLIYIIEQHGETPNSSGQMSKLSGQCKQLLNMKQQKHFDVRVNEILSGLEKIVNGISDLRNMSSDAHGAGRNRIDIKKREAVLITNATMAYCEYILTVFHDQQSPF